MRTKGKGLMEKGTKFLLDKGRLIDNGIIFLMYYQHEVWQGPITKAAKLRRYLGEAYRDALSGDDFACLLA